MPNYPSPHGQTAPQHIASSSGAAAHAGSPNTSDISFGFRPATGPVENRSAGPSYYQQPHHRVEQAADSWSGRQAGRSGGSPSGGTGKRGSDDSSGAASFAGFLSRARSAGPDRTPKLARSNQSPDRALAASSGNAAHQGEGAKRSLFGEAGGAAGHYAGERASAFGSPAGASATPGGSPSFALSSATPPAAADPSPSPRHRSSPGVAERHKSPDDSGLSFQAFLKSRKSRSPSPAPARAGGGGPPDFEEFLNSRRAPRSPRAAAVEASLQQRLSLEALDRAPNIGLPSDTSQPPPQQHAEPQTKQLMSHEGAAAGIRMEGVGDSAAAAGGTVAMQYTSRNAAHDTAVERAGGQGSLPRQQQGTAAAVQPVSYVVAHPDSGRTQYGYEAAAAGPPRQQPQQGASYRGDSGGSPPSEGHSSTGQASSAINSVATSVRTEKVLGLHLGAAISDLESLMANEIPTKQNQQQQQPPPRASAAAAAAYQPTAHTQPQHVSEGSSGQHYHNYYQQQPPPQQQQHAGQHQQPYQQPYPPPTAAAANPAPYPPPPQPHRYDELRQPNVTGLTPSPPATEIDAPERVVPAGGGSWTSAAAHHGYGDSTWAAASHGNAAAAGEHRHGDSLRPAVGQVDRPPTGQAPSMPPAGAPVAAAPGGEFHYAGHDSRPVNQPGRQPYHDQPHDSGTYHNPQHSGAYHNPQDSGAYHNHPQDSGAYHSPQDRGAAVPPSREPYHNPQHSGAHHHQPQDQSRGAALPSSRDHSPEASSQSRALQLSGGPRSPTWTSPNGTSEARSALELAVSPDEGHDRQYTPSPSPDEGHYNVAPDEGHYRQYNAAQDEGHDRQYNASTDEGHDRQYNTSTDEGHYKQYNTPSSARPPPQQQQQQLERTPLSPQEVFMHASSAAERIRRLGDELSSISPRRAPRESYAHSNSYGSPARPLSYDDSHGSPAGSRGPVIDTAGPLTPHTAGLNAAIAEAFAQQGIPRSVHAASHQLPMAADVQAQPPHPSSGLWPGGPQPSAASPDSPIMPASGIKPRVIMEKRLTGTAHGQAGIRPAGLSNPSPGGGPLRFSTALTPFTSALEQALSRAAQVVATTASNGLAAKGTAPVRVNKIRRSGQNTYR